MNPVIRIFMLGGSYVETQTFESLEDFSELLARSERLMKPFEVTGKIGERIAIRAAAVSHAVRYKY